MIIGIDIGTTALAGVLVDPATLRVLETVSAPNPGDCPGLSAGRHEQDPLRIEAVFIDLVRRLMDASPEPVTGIAFSGQMHGVVAVDAGFNPLSPLITWQDQRGGALPETLLRHRFEERTGCRLHPGYGAATVAADIRGGSFPGGCAFLLSIPGFLIARLTGRPVTDETFAASWGIWDLPERKWLAPLRDALAIPDRLLPAVVSAGHPVGQVDRGPAFLKGLTLFSPIGDNPAGVYAAQMLYPGSVVLNLGTSGQLSAVIRDYRYDPSMETRPLPGFGFFQTYATLCGGWAYAYLARFFQTVVREFAGVELSPDALYGTMDRLASDDADGLMADTRFFGSRQADGCRGGALVGISERNLQPGRLVTAFAEGIVDELARGCGIGSATAVVGLGNALRLNRSLRDAVERRLGVPCVIPDIDEMAAYGAARCALEKG